MWNIYCKAFAQSLWLAIYLYAGIVHLYIYGILSFVLVA